MVASKTISANHRDEANLLLDPSHFIVHFVDSNITDRQRRRNAVCGTLRQAKTENKEVIFIVASTTLKADAFEAIYDDRDEVLQSGINVQGSFFDPNLVFDTLFIDEVADLRNPTTGFFRAMRRLVEKSCLVVGATGTPVVNSQQDILNIGRLLSLPSMVPHHSPCALRHIRTLNSSGLVLAGSEMVPSRYDFSSLLPAVESARGAVVRMEHILGKTRAKRGRRENTAPESFTEEPPMDADHPDASTIKTAVELVKKLLRPFAIRRTHRSLSFDGTPLTDLQPVEPEVRYIIPTREEEEDFRLWTARYGWRDQQFHHQGRIKRKIPNVYEHGHFDAFEPVSSSFTMLADDLEQFCRAQDGLPDAEKEKAVIVSGYIRPIPYLVQSLAARDPPIFLSVITGDTPPAERERLVADFAKDAGIPVRVALAVGVVDGSPVYECVNGLSRILILSSVGSTGINLQRANRMFIWDVPWSHASLKQSMFRCNRIGQTREVTCKLYCHKGADGKKSFEERTLSIVLVKKRASSALFESVKSDLSTVPLAPPQQVAQWSLDAADTAKKHVEKADQRAAKGPPTLEWLTGSTHVWTPISPRTRRTASPKKKDKGKEKVDAVPPVPLKLQKDNLQVLENDLRQLEHLQEPPDLLSQDADWVEVDKIECSRRLELLRVRHDMYVNPKPSRPSTLSEPSNVFPEPSEHDLKRIKTEAQVMYAVFNSESRYQTKAHIRRTRRLA